MKRSALHRFCLLALGVVVLSCGCAKKQPPADDTTSLDRVVKQPTPAPQPVIHKTFVLQGYEKFPLEVPPNCLTPRLQGHFRSFRYGADGKRSSDDAAKIDVMLLDEQELEDFVQGDGGTVSASAQGAFEQKIEWALRSTFSKPEKYYLVFNNATGKPKSKIVEADFTLSFE